MPIYMDLHIAPGVTAREVAEAHLKDVKIQDNFCCKAMTYWLDEDKGCVFCLIEAPDKESVREMHAKAHGLTPNEIIQVNTDLVKAFLGRIQDPDDAISQPETNLKVFSDPAFRVLLIARTTDTRILQHELGKERTQELLLLYGAVIRDEANRYNGSEVYRREEGFVISFVNPQQALDCTLEIRKKLTSSLKTIGLRMVLHGGVPVEKGDSLFGSTIRFGQFLSGIERPGSITMSADVRNLFKDNDWNLTVGQDDVRSLSLSDQAFLRATLDTLAENWQNPEFDIPDFCRLMSVSKSQLYRKCVSTTGMSPNSLLREYRLLRSLEFLRKEDRNISQTTFDTGFSSPSYFTKCFQKRFGMQPLAYLKTPAV